MGMLVLAAMVFLATHVGISSTPLRSWLIDRLGTKRYLGAYSILALITLSFLISAYRRHGDLIPLWQVAPWQPWLTLMIMPIALLLLVSALSSPNPTVAGTALAQKKVAPPKGVMRITRHPTMWAIGLWALSHLLVNGDLASLILFGTLAALALFGTRLIDSRYRDRLEDMWDSYAKETSNLPFAAIIAGRQRLVWSEIGWWRTALALGLYILLIMLHPLVIGVPAFIHP